MPNTGGFEVVAELTRGVLQQILEGAWDNNVIPHSVTVPPGTAFGLYSIADGVVNIPRNGLLLAMAPADNGVRITLASEVQVEIANPPIPSAGMFDLDANIVVRVPLGTLPGTIKIAAMLNGIPRSNVTATITSGDPISALTLIAVEEYIHERYQDGTIPDHFEQVGVSLGIYTADSWLDVYDDPAKPTHQIAVSAPAPGQVKLRIPVHLKLYNISGSAPSPMGVVAKIAITANLAVTPGQIVAQLTSAAVAVEDFAPAPASDAAGSYDSEGANFSLANGFTGGLLASTITVQLQARGQQLVASVGDIVVSVPTPAQIETFIADQAHAALVARGNIALWTPEPPPGGGVTVGNVRPIALADALAIGLNDTGGADPSLIVNFIPPDRSCAIAMSAASVLQIIDQQIHRPEEEGGFGPNFPPKTFDDVDGHQARLTSLNVSLANGFIRIKGGVTVVDAIADSIDVDADFEAHVGLRWIDRPDGTQMLEPFLTEEPDVDLSLVAWILSFLLGFITFGLIGGIVVLVVLSIVDDLAERIGGVVIRDEVTGQVLGIGAWPQNLEGIGQVTSQFENPILIDSGGIMFPDEYAVTATFASTIDALAEANGPYGVPEGALVNFVGGPARPHTTFAWDFGDGAGAPGPNATHRYADNGLYVAKLTTEVHEPGGVITRHFAAVRVANVPATVDAGSPIAIDEGQVMEFVATFSDPGWLDSHAALFDFGDDSRPVTGTLSEINATPAATGTARAAHAFCDNGEYLVTVRVRDDDGGIGVATRRVTVRNLPPSVDAGEDPFAYPCTPITLVAHFTDPGWCDTHTAVWEFGDCTPPFPATVKERNQPPEGCGIAAATHRYGCCGEYHAVCTVIDDDGGVGRDTLVVRVVDVRNSGFDAGFHTTPWGAVGNHWEPHFGPEAVGPPGAHFAPEEFVVHSGQRSQRIGSAGPGLCGIHQRVGANRGWDYQVSVWYHAEAARGVRCRLGLDPAGGMALGGSTVVWSEGAGTGDWTQLSTRVTATDRAVTILLEFAAPDGRGDAYFDDVTFLPFPCPLGEAPPCHRPDQEERCVDWHDERKPRLLPATYERNGFSLRSNDPGSPLRIAIWGLPSDAGKLQLPRGGITVILPVVADRAVAHVTSGTKEPVMMEALDQAGGSLARRSGQPGSEVPSTVELRAAGIHALRFLGGGGEGLLIDLCTYRGAGLDTGERGGRHPDPQETSIHGRPYDERR